MLIKYADLPRALAKKRHAIYVLFGQDWFLLQESASRIKQSWHQDAEKITMKLDTLTDWQNLIQEANSYQLFAEHTILDASYDKKTWDHSHKAVFNTYLSRLNTKCLVLLRTPHMKNTHHQWLANHPDVLLVQIQALNALNAQQYIADKLTAYQLRYTAKVPHMIQQVTEGNLAAAVQVVEKLNIIYPKTTVINEGMVHEQLVIACDYPFYELTDACLKLMPEKAIHILQTAAQKKTEPTLLLWYLTQYIRQLLQLHRLTETMTCQLACQQLKIWSSQISYYNKVLHRRSQHDLLRVLRYCHDIDLTIKSNTVQRAWSMLEDVVLVLVGDGHLTVPI